MAEGAVNSVLADVSAGDLEAAMSASTMPVIVCDERTVVVRLVNSAAVALVGRPAAEMIGRSALDFLCDPEHVREAQAVLLSGAVDSFNGRRSVRRGDGRTVPVFVWTKTVRVDGRPHSLTLAVPDTEMGRLGRDPARGWRDLATVAVGSLDEGR